MPWSPFNSWNYAALLFAIEECVHIIPFLNTFQISLHLRLFKTWAYAQRSKTLGALRGKKGQQRKKKSELVILL